MSLEEVADLKDRVALVSERLARMEERQVTLYHMVERSLSSYGDLANRVSGLEHLRTKVVVVAGLIGAGMSLAWDFFKTRFQGGS